MQAPLSETHRTNEGERKLRALENKRKKIGIYGHFGSSNFGNEITLQTILYHLRRLLHQSDTICICTGPEALAASQDIETVPISRTIVRQWEL